MSEQTKIYKSRYIAEVEISDKYIKLLDSTHADYYIDPSNTIAIKQFESWFKNVFSKGVNQFLLVFKCHTVVHDGQCDVIIDKFLNVPLDEKKQTKISRID